MAPRSWSSAGTDDDYAIRLMGYEVSRRPAALHDDSTLSVVDLGSRNGTRVNGFAVQSAPLRANDVPRTGGCVLVLVDSKAEIAEIVPGLAGGATRAARSRASLAPERAQVWNTN